MRAARQPYGSFSTEFIDQRRDAAHNVGCFQITGYGAAPGQAEELLALIKQFFDLPLEERMKLDNRISPHFRGYTRMGTEITQGRADAREQIDYSPEREPVNNYPADQPYWLLQGHNMWPDEALPELKPAAMAWAELMSSVGMELLRGISVSSGLPEAHFVEHFGNEPGGVGTRVHYVGRGGGAAGAAGARPWSPALLRPSGHRKDRFGRTHSDDPEADPHGVPGQ